MTVQTTKTTPELWKDWQCLTESLSHTINLPMESFTGAFYRFIEAEKLEFYPGSKAQRAVFNMCYTMLDAAGLWHGIFEDNSEPGKITYYATDSHGADIIEIVRNQMNVIARSFRLDDAIAICDDMIEAWEKGVPALDVLA